MSKTSLERRMNSSQASTESVPSQVERARAEGMSNALPATRISRRDAEIEIFDTANMKEVASIVVTAVSPQLRS